MIGLSLNDAVDKMRGPPNSKIVLTIKRQNVEKPIEVSLIRETIKIQVVKSRMEPNDIGYVRLSQFTEQADAGIKAAVKALKQQNGGKLRGLVLDLRNNPGGLLDQAVAVSSDFIDQGEIVSTRARHPEDSQRWDAKGDDILNGAPLVVLINGGSASASEIVSGALQDHRRAILLGTGSFGKGSVQTVIPLPGNGAMRLTTARYYTPSGRSIQGLGITPDVPVQETRDERPSFGGEHEADYNKILTQLRVAPARRRCRRAPTCRRSPSRSRTSRRRISRNSIRPSLTRRTSSCRRRGAGQGNGGAKERLRQLNLRDGRRRPSNIGSAPTVCSAWVGGSSVGPQAWHVGGLDTDWARPGW